MTGNSGEHGSLVQDGVHVERKSKISKAFLSIVSIAMGCNGVTVVTREGCEAQDIRPTSVLEKKIYIFKASESTECSETRNQR